MSDLYGPGRGRRLAVATGPGAHETEQERQPSAHRGARTSRLLEFAAVCVVLTWIPWAVLGALGTNVEEGPGLLVFGLAASGPSLAALVMWLRRRGDKHPGPRVRWSIGWPVVAVVLGGAATAVTVLLLNVTDLAAIPEHASSTIAEAGGPLAALAFTFLAGPIAEEFGWRGYVQPRLRQHYGRLVTVAVLGAAWGLWHVPLFFLTGTGQHDDGLFTQHGLVFFLGFFPLSYLMLFVTEHLRGGVPAAILVHAAWNLSDALVPPLGAGGTWLRLVLLTGLAGAVGLRWRHALAIARPTRHDLRWGGP